MKLNRNFSIWWGPPKDFQTGEKDRRVSWLELFFDLVYVIAIARITHHLAHNMHLESFLESICLFVLVYWGWLNGSLHHDLHGNQGLRTRLMTLWQMMIIAALAIILDNAHGNYNGITIIFMIMQLYITYMWWSVGLYDREHRKYSGPYIGLYLVSFCLMGLSLWLPNGALTIILPIIFLCNYAPPFIAHRLLKRASKDLDLSSSMFERLGLFTIIIFGELVLGVVNGSSHTEDPGFVDWINFALGISVVFALWWIFFTFVSTRQVQKGLYKASLLELLYIPALIALGFIAVSLSAALETHEFTATLQRLFGVGTAIFLCCIYLIMELLVYPAVFDTLKRPMQISLLLTALLFLIIAFLNFPLTVTGFLALTGVVLTLEISYLNFVYYRKLLKEGIDPANV